ncbi:MAG: hypothetical protein HN509_07100 [Halobacteriovoraceae bacterium]|jgi:hypothetical protein|nr:hypothetical protein [Halobacteriovoraceae bacterium]MBT5096086.1 hypothetical protein [Halobacteriovoraceae bacterium]
MELVKETKDYKVFKKRSGRFGVQNLLGKWINGEDKTKILVGEKLIKAALSAKKEEPAAEEAATEETAE